jgi:hypothetical protein
MQTIAHVPPAPAIAQAPSVQTAPGSITITGSDGKTKTITFSRDGIAVTGAPAAALAPAPPTPDLFAPGAAAGVSMTLLTLGVFALYRRFKRRGMKKDLPQLLANSTERFDRLERGMEAIAIEVERISEGQRFVTKMMSESRAPAIASEKPAN